MFLTAVSDVATHFVSGEVRFDLFPHENGASFPSVMVALIRRRRDREDISVEFVEPDLILAGPCLVPRHVDMMDDLLSIECERTRIGHHRPKQLDALLVLWHHVAGNDTVTPDEDRIHSPVGRVAEVTIRISPN